jgi:hypothetical protein
MIHLSGKSRLGEAGDDLKKVDAERLLLTEQLADLRAEMRSHSETHRALQADHGVVKGKAVQV